MDPLLEPVQRFKRHPHHHHHHHNGGYRHHFHRSYVHDYDDDGDDEGEDGHHHTTGRDVAHLSFLTEKFGHDMSHDIDMGTREVEAVGDAIENSSKRF